MAVLNFVLSISLLCGLSAGLSLKGAPQPLTDEAKLTELRNSVTTHLRRLGGEPNGAQLELLRLHSATSQTVAGSLYKILAELNENSQTVNCTLSLWEKPWENFIKFDVECGDDEPKRTYGFIDPIILTTSAPFCAGCPSQISEESLKDFHPRIVESFTKLGSKYDDFDLVVKRIVSGTSQVVAGARYVLNVEATNPKEEVKTCVADIWDKPWEHFYQVKLTCKEKDYEIHL